MNTQRDLAPRLRLTGLLASVIAVAAMAVTILANNQNAGFGQIVTRREQMFLFIIALLLLAGQTIGYLVHRASRPTKDGTDRTTTAARSTKG
jgi:uncharacterized membrane protein YphA (DoxX/SURF4 family)